jgi:small subunit ribosomal protein S21
LEKHLQVFVRDNNVDQSLRVVKEKMQREGVFREMRRRKACEKPSERKIPEKTEAILSAEGRLETGPARRSTALSSERG